MTFGSRFRAAPRAPDERGAPGVTDAAVPLKWGPSKLVRFIRRPLVWWGLVALLGAMTTWALLSMGAQAQELQDSWGETQRVAVVTAPLDLGDPLAEAVEWQDYPLALAPPTVVTELVGDEVASAHLFPGEVVLASDLLDSGSALAHRLPDGTAAVAIVSGAGWPELSVGDRVDLLATFPVAEAGAGSPTRRVSADAMVVEVRDGVVTVAIPEDEVTTVAHSLARAVILAVLVGR